jgi:hypothetical protein
MVYAISGHAGLSIRRPVLAGGNDCGLVANW